MHGDGVRSASVLVIGVVPLLVHAEAGGFRRMRVGAGHDHAAAVDRGGRIGALRCGVSIDRGGFHGFVFGLLAAYHDRQVEPICSGITGVDVDVAALAVHLRIVGFSRKLAI